RGPQPRARTRKVAAENPGRFTQTPTPPQIPPQTPAHTQIPPPTPTPIPTHIPTPSPPPLPYRGSHHLKPPERNRRAPKRPRPPPNAPSSAPLERALEWVGWYVSALGPHSRSRAYL